MPVPDQTLRRTRDPPTATLSASHGCHHAVEDGSLWAWRRPFGHGLRLRDELRRTVCSGSLRWRLFGGAQLPRGHERRDGPVASNTLGVLKRSQRVAVTLLGTGYSPHEGVPGRRCALDAVCLVCLACLAARHPCSSGGSQV